MKNILIFTLIAGLLFSLSACTQKSGDSAPAKAASYAQQLFDQKNPYIGDNSADIKLLSLLNISDELGDYTIELQTSTEPYVLKLNFKDPVENRDAFDLKMQNNAYVILALIDNAGVVQWSYKTNENNEAAEIIVTVRTEDATAKLGKDVKAFGKTPEHVQELLDQLKIDN